MTVTFAAPYDSSVVSMTIPSPSTDNEEAVRATLISSRAVDGTLYAYVKKTDQFDVTLEFTEISRMKVLEVFEFVKAYHGMHIRYTDFDGNLWKASIVEETLSSETLAMNRCIDDLPEVGSFTLKLLASKQFGDKIIRCNLASSMSINATVTMVKE